MNLKKLSIVSAVALITACGGGGGGGGGSSTSGSSSSSSQNTGTNSTTPVNPTPVSPVAPKNDFDDSEIAQTIAKSFAPTFEIGSFDEELADQIFSDILGGGFTISKKNCTNGGSIEKILRDNDNSATLTAGDRISVTYLGCVEGNFTRDGSIFADFTSRNVNGIPAEIVISNVNISYSTKTSTSDNAISGSCNTITFNRSGPPVRTPTTYKCTDLAIKRTESNFTFSSDNFSFDDYVVSGDQFTEIDGSFITKSGQKSFEINNLSKFIEVVRFNGPLQFNPNQLSLNLKTSDGAVLINSTSEKTGTFMIDFKDAAKVDQNRTGSTVNFRFGGVVLDSK